MFKNVLKFSILSVVVISLVGCGSKFDSAGYAKSALDAHLKQDFTEYMKLTDSTEEEVQKEYNDSMKEIVDSFSASMGMALSEEQKTRVEEFFKDLFAHASYEVGEAVKVDNEEDTVDIKIKPITNLNNLEAIMEEYANDFVARLQTEEFADMSQEELENELVDGILTELENTISTIEYGAEQTVTVHVKTNKEEKLRYIPDEDYEKIMDVVIEVPQ